MKYYPQASKSQHICDSEQDSQRLPLRSADGRTPSPLSPGVRGGGSRAGPWAHAKDVSQVDELAGRGLTQFYWGPGDSVGQVRTYSQRLK